MADKLNTQCVTPEFSTSYVNVWEAKMNDQGKLKYSLSMLFPKGTDLSEMEKCAENAIINTWGSDKSKWPKKLRMPFRDGDEDRPDDEPYVDKIFVNTSIDKKPPIVDLYRNPITDPDEFYSGCRGRAQGNFATYNNNGNVGVSFYVNSLLKTADGERFGGGPSAVSAFANYFEDAVTDSSALM